MKGYNTARNEMCFVEPGQSDVPQVEVPVADGRFAWASHVNGRWKMQIHTVMAGLHRRADVPNPGCVCSSEDTGGGVGRCVANHRGSRVAPGETVVGKLWDVLGNHARVQQIGMESLRGLITSMCGGRARRMVNDVSGW